LGLQYQSTLSEIPITDEALPIIENFIQIIGYRLQMADSAQRTVSNYLDKYNFSPKVRAKLKIILGDLNIIQNQIWEASLLYSQVELEFKEDVLGNEAKFKNAKVSFYAGDFAWAQSQLDALKGSTSKLVSNDAIDLSVLILESIPDSIETPLEIYARAELLAKQYQYNATFTTLDSIAKEFPGHPLIDEALYLKATISYDQMDWINCEKYLKEIIEFHFTELKYDDAMMMMGQLNEYHLNNKEEAMKWYEKILTEQPGSLLVTEARKSYRRLRGDQMQ
jgi:TolA-binding protein